MDFRINLNPTNTGKSFDSIFVRYLGGGSRKQKLPPVADPAPTPESIQQGAATLGERERRLAKRRKGRRSLILTEGGLGSATVERQSLLGNTGVA